MAENYVTIMDTEEATEKKNIFQKAGDAIKSGATKVKESKVAKIAVGAGLVVVGAVAGAALTAKANKSEDDDLIIYDLDDPEDCAAIEADAATEE